MAAGAEAGAGAPPRAGVAPETAAAASPRPVRRRGLRLKTKLTLGVSLLVLVAVAAVSFLYVTSLVRAQMLGIVAHAQFVSRTLFSEVRQELTGAAAAGLVNLRQPGAAEQYLTRLNTSAPLAALMGSAIGYPVNSSIRDVAVVNRQNLVLADSDPELVGQILGPRPDLAAVGQAGWLRQLEAIFGRERIYEVRLPIVLGTSQLGAVRVGVDTALVRAALAGRIHSVLLVALLVVVLATVLALAFADLALSPLNAVSAQLDRAERGEGEPEPAAARYGAEYGQVSSKIERLGRKIQDARQVYSSLRESVSQVLEGLEEGVVLFGPEGQAVMASAAAQRFLGRPAEGIVGLPVEAVFPGDSRLDRAVRRAVREQVALPPQEMSGGPDGRPLWARLDRLRAAGAGGDGQNAAGTASALLVLRDAEPVRRLESELELARRLSAIGRLTRGVAHEVKNPLNAMAIHLDLLKAKVPGPEVGRHVAVIRREIDRLDRVVKAFLDFTRPVEVRLRPASLAEVAAGVRDLLAADASAQGMHIEVRAEEAPPLWLDRDLVEQALLNLVNNALQAMGEHGAGNGAGSGGAANGADARSAPPRVTLTVRQEAGGVALRVRDNGPGVPPEVRDRIFDLYFSTKPEGSGIGLALATRVMQLHNGSLELEPEGPGACFCLRFPARVAAPPEDL
ncbi:MAG: two-component system sensor histidine kinase NtrB [Terriglobales bacterium]